MGLGDPPLSVADPEIEYLFAPSRCYQRFGNSVCYNKWSMRSTEGERFDVLVLGDSVVNGGALTDQRDLATEILASRTGASVGNISAGSWGPENLLAYTKRYGWFGARTAVFAFGSDDLLDVRTFQELGPDLPTKRPPLALWEVVTRYGPRYFALSPEPPPPRDHERGLAAVRSLLRSAAGSVDRVCVIFHRALYDPKEPPAVETYRRIASEVGGTFALLQEQPEDYRDVIHLSETGQRRLAAVAERECLRSSPSPEAPLQ